MMADTDRWSKKSVFLLFLGIFVASSQGNDILGCGGFVKSHVSLDYSKIEIGVYSKSGSLKERTECAPTNGYYFLPLYEKGDYVLKVHPPPGWSFEPSQVELRVDGVTDPCSTGQDINFDFNGFGIAGKVITAGQQQGPHGVSVQLISETGDKRNTVTSAGGDFHFTPVIPGKYTVKAEHPKWKLEPTSAVVQVAEGNTALPTGVLAVKGYDVTGTVSAYGGPIAGLFVLLYSKEASPKLRVEGCNTALLQGVPDAPICHSITDQAGQFSFGLVPAGEYSLVALASSPGQNAVTYNVKPDSVPFTVAHDSLFIKDAFEVRGFTVSGAVLVKPGGPGLSAARVLLDGAAKGNTDSNGRFTLAGLQPGTYSVTVQHEQCQIEPVQLSITRAGPSAPLQLAAARWRVCGAVTGPGVRTVRIDGAGARGITATVDTDNDGKWCTYLSPGTYNAKVEVTESEQSDGLQFYPLVHKLSVGHGTVGGVTFSQLKATLTGRVHCMGDACEGLQVTLRPLSPDGGYVGHTMTTTVTNGEYKFVEVLPGSVEVSVPSAALCWQEATHNVAVTQELAQVPSFEHTGYVIRVEASHPTEVEYASNFSSGVVSIQPANAGEVVCVARPGKYTLTAKGCHRYQADTVEVATHPHRPPTVTFTAVSHAVVIRVLSPVAVDDLQLRVSTEGAESSVGPLQAAKGESGGFEFIHTIYMADGEITVVSAHSSSLLFQPKDPQQLVGRADCQPHALTLRAVPGLTLSGRTKPPVEGVTITLSYGSGDPIQTLTTSAEGTYSFGPLDASQHYTVTAAKESYTFAAPDLNGDIAAHKLAEITVTLLDEADGSPLQGALVSVSGGSYRRNALSDASGSLRLPSLTPTDYYIKPHMKEYRFNPTHTIAKVDEGKTHHITLRGVRIAWSCVGVVVGVGGEGWPDAAVAAQPQGQGQGQGQCATEEATTDAQGHFRIRGLLPGCKYELRLKATAATAATDGAALSLATPRTTVEITENKDISNVRLIATQPHHVTDATALIRTPSVDHYKTLRLTLALDHSPHSPIYSTKLDAAGYSQHINPGLVYVLPRLPADNKTYVLQLESSLSKATHTYKDEVYYFNSDGVFKHFTIEFLPKVRSSEQELRQTSLIFIPLLALVGLAYYRRDQLVMQLSAALESASRNPRLQRPKEREQREVLDKASIEHIVNTVNAAGKRVGKKKAA